MFNLDITNTHNFNWQEKLHKVDYCFTRLDNAERKLSFNQIWLVIHFEHSVLKISKPQNILKQPKEIIEKVVEREVKEYLSNEVLEKL